MMPEECWLCRTPGNCGVAPVVIDVEEVTPEERQRRRQSRRNGAAPGVDVKCDAGRCDQRLQSETGESIISLLVLSLSMMAPVD